MEENILKIPEDKFTVDVEKEFLSNLIEKAIKKAGGTWELANILVNKHNLKKYSYRGLSDRLRKWQRKKHRIYLNYYLSLSKFLNIGQKFSCSKINKFYFNKSSASISLKYPLIISKELIAISELIRVEGYMDKKNNRIILENTNMDLIQKFKKYIKTIGVNMPIQDLRIKVMVPENINLNDIIIKNLGSKKLKPFYSRILKLKRGIKKEIIFIEQNVRANTLLNYLIKLKGKRFNLKISIPKKGKITSITNLKYKLPYQIVTPSLILVMWNGSLFYILNEILKIQRGKKSGIIFIPPFVKNLPKDLIKEAISLVLAAESTVTSSSVKITSLSKKYIQDFLELLKKFNITSRIDKKGTTISIYGNRNFKKIKNNFNFIIEYKNKKFNELLDITMHHSPNGLSKILYLKSLLELNTATAIEIRNKSGRVGNSFRQYINELLSKRYINPITNIRPKRYEITEKGKIFLENNNMYWLD